MVQTCTCNHEGQDKIHGKGRRVFNLLAGKDKARCTVCGKEKMVSKKGGEEKKKKK